MTNFETHLVPLSSPFRLARNSAFARRTLAAGVTVALASAAAADPLPAEVDLASLLPAWGGDGSEGFVLEGGSNGDLGRSVSAAGDINHDGIADVIVSDPSASPPPRGLTFVLFGRDTAQSGNFAPLFPLRRLLPDNGGDGSAGFAIEGFSSLDEPGDRVAGIGDVNGDGVDDLIVGARYAGLGQAYVVFGRDTSQNGNFPAKLSVESLAAGDGSDGFVINGEFGLFGRGVGPAGDLNADGIGDFVVGDTSADWNGKSNAGAAFVFLGRDTAQSGNFPPVVEASSLIDGDGSAGFMLVGEFSDDRAGEGVQSVGDVNGDGIADLGVSSKYSDANGVQRAGRAYILYGRDTAVVGNFPAIFELASLLPPGGGDGSEGFALNGFGEDNRFGSVGTAGDMNGDGIEDLCVGTMGHFETAPGQIALVFGRDAAQSGPFPAVVNLVSLLPSGGGDGSAGFIINGVMGDDFGLAVGAGDINADGLSDLVIGAPEAHVSRQPDTGRAYVIYGRDTAQSGNFSAVLPVRSLFARAGGDGSVGFVMNGIAEDNVAGWSVDAAGDLNADGVGDLVIGSPFAGPEHDGRAFVLYGRAP
jgi:hypothetical protein